MEPKKKSLLRKMRVKSGISQKDLAKRAGISRTTISSLEYNRYPMGELTARRLADVFHCDWKLFMGKK